MNRMDRAFQALRARGRKAFVAYLTAGYPDLRTTEELAVSFSGAGVDILELGVPFSDPLADGPVIQAASHKALQGGVTMAGILDTVRRIRQRTQLPLALMTYYNPVFHYGVARLVEEASRAGVDGLIIPDLPVEEAGELISLARPRDFATVFFLAPTTSLERMPAILKASRGFVYFVSVAGVTGTREGQGMDPAVCRKIRQARKLSGIPVCLGFGISTPSQVAAMAQEADGVIVGSAIIRAIDACEGSTDIVRKVTLAVRELASPLQQAG